MATTPWRSTPPGDALERAQSYRPDVMLLDIGLPEMNGYEVAVQLRRDGGPQRMRLIALTGYGQAGDLARARAAGFDDHLMKPVEWPALQRALEGVYGSDGVACPRA
jgi:CheY-like chemotaxis protein